MFALEIILCAALLMCIISQVACVVALIKLQNWQEEQLKKGEWQWMNVR